MSAPTSRGVIAVDKVGNAIRFYDPDSFAETKVLTGPEPTVHELAVAPDRRTAFVPLYGDGIYGNNKNPNNKVVVVDLNRQAIASIIDLGTYFAPHGMVALSDESLWVVCDIAQVLLKIDPAEGKVTAAFPCSAKGPHLVLATPDESKLYVSCKEGPLQVFDLKRGAFVKSIPIGDPAIPSGNGCGCEGMAFSGDGKRLVVIDNDESDLHVIDTERNRKIDRVALKDHPPTNAKRSRLTKPAFSPGDRHLIVTSYATGAVWVLDGGNFRKQHIVPVAKGPMGILFPPDGDTAIVANHDSGVLTRIGLASARAVGVHDGGSGIEVLAYY